MTFNKLTPILVAMLALSSCSSYEEFKSGTAKAWNTTGVLLDALTGKPVPRKQQEPQVVQVEKAPEVVYVETAPEVKPVPTTEEIKKTAETASQEKNSSDDFETLSF